MKKKVLAAVLAAVCLTGVIFTVSYSTDDPLITESYLNEVFFDRVKEYIASHTATSSGGGDSSFKLVSVNKNKSFVASEGCEFIIRQGSGKAVVSASGGISDVTDGIDIAEGVLPLNHHFIIPRDDGRGFKAETDMLVLVKGGYSIK